MKLSRDAPSDVFPPRDETRSFLDKNDLADSLTTLYSSLEGGSVSILNGRWGVGKSTFARRWGNQLRDSGFGVIQFDAFAHDYMGEPFDALITAILRKAAEEKKGSSPILNKIKDRAAAVSKSLAVTGLKAGVRVVTLNALNGSDIEALSDAAKGLSGDLAGAAESAAKNLLERQATDMAAFETFRNSLDDIHSISGAIIR